MTTDSTWTGDDQLLPSRSRSSSQSTFNDSPSIPPSPWDSARHSRFPSSNSSISSSPILRSSQDSFRPNRKVILEGLPEIDEDAQQDSLRAPSPPAEYPSHQSNNNNPQKARPTSFFPSSHGPIDSDGFLSDYEGHWNKRRRSNDSSWNNFTSGVIERLPSLSKRTRPRKHASMSFVDDRVEFTPAVVSPDFLYRSGSQSRSLHRAPSVRNLEAQVEEHIGEIDVGEDHATAGEGEPQTAPGQIETMMQDFSNDSMLNLDDPERMNEDTLQFVDEPRSTTPILPQLMHKTCVALEMASPLQSPTVATQSPAESDSESHTPEGTPKHSAVGSPTVSARPSVASIHRSHVASLNNLPPLVLVDPTDEWAEKLGHANFHISPAPYFPDYCDELSCKRLFQDWEKAREEYAKHRSRTETYFGGSSRTFKLTEEKWTSIDAQWRANSELATRKAIENGSKPRQAAMEPAPVARIPLIDDPRLLQSEDIPGPMKIEEAVRPINSDLTRRRSKRAQFLRLLGGFQFPGKALGRATVAGVR